MDKTLFTDEQLIKTVRKCGERGNDCGDCSMSGEPGCLTQLANELADRLEKAKRYATGQECYLHLPCPMGSDIFIIVSKRSRVNLPYHHWIKKSKLTFNNLERVLNEWGERVFLTEQEAQDRLMSFFKVKKDE